jgi:hypothetical protein
MSTAFPLPPLPSARWASDPIERAARLSTDAPRIPWDVFLKELQWMQGEHFAFIGPTGQGKTTMVQHLLPKHPYVAVLATKPRDDTMDKLVSNGYQKMHRWRSLDPNNVPRRVIWPKASKLSQLVTAQNEVFEDAFDSMYLEGGWTVGIDELWWYTNILHLQQQVRILLLQGRSMGLSLAASTQRPAFVPTELYSQSTHLMFWRDNEKKNLERLGELNTRDASLVRSVVQDLEAHKKQVLYINTRTGRMLRTHVPRSVVFGEGVKK